MDMDTLILIQYLLKTNQVPRQHWALLRMTHVIFIETPGSSCLYLEEEMSHREVK